MAVFIALLRGINVTGANQLPMKELVALCGDCGFAKSRTWIQSGNAIFESRLKEEAVQQKLEKALAAKMGKKIAVVVRTPAELRALLDSNPFPDKERSKVLVAFLAGPMPPDPLRGSIAPGGEEVRIGQREVVIYYPDGVGRSKLKLPLDGVPTTARNMNTIAKLVELAQG